MRIGRIKDIAFFALSVDGKKMKYLSSNKRNVFITVFITIACFILYHKSGVLDNAGMAAIILNWLPIIIGLVTIVIYFIINVISSKYSWIVMLLGNLFNLVLVLSAFWSTYSFV